MSDDSRDASPANSDAPSQEVSLLRVPPTTPGGILRQLGPGLILAGAIVGSGELIATTRVGADVGFTLLWLIIIGCIIKVFVQIELGRYTIINAQTTLTALNTVPGPRLTIPLGSTSARGNWITWFWLLMFLASIGQLGGIVGGVGQAMAISMPLSQQGRLYNRSVEETIAYKTKVAHLHHLDLYLKETGNVTEKDKALIARLELDLASLIDRPQVKRMIAAQKLADVGAQLKAFESPPGSTGPRGEDVSEEKRNIRATLQADQRNLTATIDAIPLVASSADDKIWAAILGVFTSIVLVAGRYRLIEVFSIFFVIVFTVITIGNVIAMQGFGEWAVRGSDLAHGLSFQLPGSAPGAGNINPLATALAAFGIIGVGASELMAYPYWCIEKGYAKWTGKPDDSDAWLSRARGWLRVMKWDAWCSMALYTVATIAFYLLGAAVLHRTGLRPSDSELIPTLTNMYEPVFGRFAPTLFLIGAVAVLYSTYFSASAANARQAADIIDAFRIHRLNETIRRRWVRFFSGFFPLACVIIYWVYPRPVTLVLLSGVMQALLLPMLGIAALHFRYKRCDQRLRPGKVWDIFLWLSFIAFLIVGGYLAYVNVMKWFG